MAREYMKHSIDQLEELLKKHSSNHQVLGELRSELTYRSTPRAKQLLREVDGLINGVASPLKKDMKPPTPDDQGALFSPKGKKE